MNLDLGGLRFGIFRFVPIPNGKFTHFFIFYSVRPFGLVQGSAFFGRFGGLKFSFRVYEPRFGRFEVQFSLGSGSSRFIPSLIELYQ